LIVLGVSIFTLGEGAAMIGAASGELILYLMLFGSGGTSVPGMGLGG
jgi:hypothetical protein